MRLDRISSVRSTHYEAAHLVVCVAAGPQTRIAVSGEIDIASVPVLEDAFRDVDYRSVRQVVLDLADLDFIGVAGLRAVLALHAACTRSATSLTIIPGPRRVQRLFELTGTYRELPFAGR